MRCQYRQNCRVVTPLAFLDFPVALCSAGMWLLGWFSRSGKVPKADAANAEGAHSDENQGDEQPLSQLDRFLNSEALLHLALSFVGGGCFVFVAPACKKVSAMYKTIEHKHPPSLPSNESQLVQHNKPAAAHPDKQQLSPAVKGVCTCSTSFCSVFESLACLEAACNQGFPLTAFHGGFGAGVYASQDVLEYAMQHGAPRFEVYLGAAAAGQVQTMRYLKGLTPQTALFKPEELARCAAQYGHTDVLQFLLEQPEVRTSCHTY
jgi:hypothetical protein